MLLSFCKWLLVTVLTLLVLAAIGLSVSARLSLDNSYRHSQSIASLPLYPEKTGGGEFRLRANGQEFRIRSAGCDSATQPNPAVILLHGFPVNSGMWLPLLESLAGAGFCVIAPDQRGYSPGARPASVDDYSTDQLSNDILAIADTLGIERFNLVGHDWGSVVGWVTVLRAQQRIISWTGLSIAHPGAFAEALETDPDQQARSRYFFVFTTPWLAETLLSFNNLQLLRQGYAGLPAAQVEELVDMLAEPGALTAVLNWYRAMELGNAAAQDVSPNVTVPSLFIWGNKDVAVGRRSVELQSQYMQGIYREMEMDAGHWLIREQPEQVLAAVLKHLQAFGEP